MNEAHPPQALAIELFGGADRLAKITYMKPNQPLYTQAEVKPADDATRLGVHPLAFKQATCK